MAVKEWIIGTRGSSLATVQAETVAQQLKLISCSVRIEFIKTEGDLNQSLPLHQIGGKGLFTKELDEALLSGRIDIAVHSLKDLPTELPRGLRIAAVSERESPYDCFIPRIPGTKLCDLSDGATLGTSSLRRRAQLLAWRQGLSIVDVRGNVDTRLRKLHESNWDGIILAAAGLARLNLQEKIGETIEPELVLPAVGQGALGIVTRDSDRPLVDILRAAINDAGVEIATCAERAFLAAVEGGCQVPVGALGRLQGDRLELTACIASLDGKRCLRGTLSGSPQRAAELGRGLAEDLRARGGDAILQEIRAR